MTMSRRELILKAGLGLAAGRLLADGTPAAAASPSPVPADLTDWKKVKEQFNLSPKYIHLAGLLLASHPKPVRDAIEEYRRRLDENPVEYLGANRRALEEKARHRAAEYLQVDDAGIALTDSTTMGLGLLYTGLRVGKNDEILTTVHDHSSTHRSLAFVALRSGVKIKSVVLYLDPAAVTQDSLADNLCEAITERTRVVAITWVHSSTGVKLPIRKIAERIAELNARRAPRARILLCVDGVHGFGVDAVTMEELGCDFFVAGCHKWIFGPRGTGIVWGAPSAWARVHPTVPSFSGMLTPGQVMTPGGFHSFEHRWALDRAFDFHLRIGKTRIAERIHELNRRLKESLASIPGLLLRTPLADEVSAGIVCFDVAGLSSKQVVERLREKAIIASTTPYLVSHARLTPGILNSPDDVDRAVEALRVIAG